MNRINFSLLLTAASAISLLTGCKSDAPATKSATVMGPSNSDGVCKVSGNPQGTSGVHRVNNYKKENDVEQTIGVPILCRIPVIKYLFSIEPDSKEHSYSAVPSESTSGAIEFDKANGGVTGIDRRIENPFRPSKSEDVEPKK